MFSDYRRAISQVFDHRFIKVLIKAIGLTLGLLIGLTTILLYFISFIPSMSFTIPLIGYEVTFLEELAETVSFGLVLILSSFLMFPVAALFVGLFLDEIADAVEARHYPDLPEPRRQSWGEVLTQSIEFMFVLIGANIVALIIYLLSTLLAPVIFWLVNGYLLGREYFEVVAMRRIDKREAKSLRQKHFFAVWMAGALIAVPLSIPILNVLAPVIGVAAFVHLYHRKVAAEQLGSRV